MPAAPVRLALFDCDGTLVDSQHHICSAMERAFGDVGLAPPPRAIVRRQVGLSLAEVIRSLLPDAGGTLHEALVARYRAAFFELRSAGTIGAEPLYPGIAELLETLSAQGWRLGVATGKSDRGLAHILAHHGIAGHFVTLQTADRHPSKPHPAMIEAALAEVGVAAGDAVMIGDTSFDMAMAVSAGVRAIGVGWGYHPNDELVAAGAVAVAEDVGELSAMLA
ncbi:MAG: haloacid dehalogenase [Proteobacteria bacterium SG_bin6]|nr:MAG: haloacid dehalogenase [Proteobacteria bacterium SG_bin6]